MEARTISQSQRRYRDVGNRWGILRGGGGGGREVPAWEKRFCLVVGRMRWRDFLDCKEHVSCSLSRSCFDSVMRWDDTAAYECFRDAKARFYAENYSDSYCRTRSPSRGPPGPGMYVDDVVWRAPGDDEDWELRWLTEEAEEARERTRELAAARRKVDYVYSWAIPMEEMKATGWDDCSSVQNPTLIGMVVGGGGDVDDGSGEKRRTAGRREKGRVSWRTSRLWHDAYV